jgi:hypothetical protein
LVTSKMNFLAVFNNIFDDAASTSSPYHEDRV